MMDLIKLIINNIYNHKMLIVCSLLLMIALPESDAAAAVPNPYLDTEISTACPDNGQLFARIVHCFEDKKFQGTYYILNMPMAFMLVCHLRWYFLALCLQLEGCKVFQKILSLYY